MLHGLRRGARAFIASNGLRIANFSARSLEILCYFAEPKSLSAAQAAGFADSELTGAIASELILSLESDSYPKWNTWNVHGWCRAGFLLGSQANLGYGEPIDEDKTLEELTDYRRAELQNYLKGRPYPARATKAGVRRKLPKIRDSEVSHVTFSERPVQPRPDRDREFPVRELVERRTVRSFSHETVSVASFGEILFECSRQIRAVEESRLPGDPYYLLNSFYCWLGIYVAVQGVEGVKPGAYQYDPLAHELVEIGSFRNDESLAECIHAQPWIGGGGFCIVAVADWERYMWIYRQSRAYINLLLQVGEFGQEVIEAASVRALGVFMTPAVSESATSDLFRLDDSREEAIYFLKVGVEADSRKNCAASPRETNEVSIS